jgi:NADH-quinone oxidoreductase subunit H
MLGAAATNAGGAMVGSAVVGMVSFLAFAAKTLVLLVLFIWFRASWPRVRYDMLMDIGWKWLLPLSIVNVVMTAVVTVLVPGAYAQAGILLVLGIIILAGTVYINQNNRVTRLKLQQTRIVNQR